MSGIDRKRRFQHMGDVRIQLEEALAALGTDASRGEAATMPHRAWQVSGAIALVALASAAGWWLASRVPAQTPAAVVWLSLPSMEAPRAVPSGRRHLAVSSDGSQMAYASASHLLIRQMVRKEAVVVEVAASDPFFSPNGEWVGFFGDAGNLN